MSQIPEDLKYTKEDEWIRVDGDVGTIGITDYAQDSLSDIVYLELPAEGDSFSKDEIFGVVESVKAASDLIMPVSGTVAAVNEDLVDEPELVNDDPYGDAWMIQIELSEPDQINDLMDAQAYRASTEARE